MAILVLGGAGYIGSHMVKRLIEADRDVVVVDALFTGHREAVNPKAKFYQVDIRDKTALSEVFDKENIEQVVHFAAFSIVPESVANPLKYFDNNTSGMITLLEVMKEHDVKQIVFSSTAATYGNPVNIPIKETDPQRPINPYGESKLIMEKMMKWQSQATDMTYVALRYFNVAGAKDDGSIGEAHKNETHLIPIILQTALGQREFITIYGDDYHTPDGTCIRDYIHVSDLASAHVLAIEKLIEGMPSAVLNLGTGEGTSVKEMIDAAEKVTGKKLNVTYAGRRAGDPATLIASSEKARNLLGWKPQITDIEEIIRTTWNLEH